jgi:nucleoside-diphosphate-sugar epimerase
VRYFVTGATGFIGGRVARQLRIAGHEVTAIARDPTAAGALAAIGVAVHRGDVTRKETLRAPMSGADGVFHVAGWYKTGARESATAQATNVDGTRNVLELMRELAIPKGVYTSTLAVFSDTRGYMPDETYRYTGPHLSTYDRTKWLAHYRVAEPMIEAGLPLVIVQPGLAYGPGDTSLVRDTFVQFLQRRLPAAPSRTAYCWAHVDDVARGHILAMEKGRAGQRYIIAGPRHTLVEALAVAEAVTGVAAPRLHPPPLLVKAAAVLMEPLSAAIDLPAAYTAEGLRSIAGVTYLGSNAKARRELGYSVRALEDGLRETLTHELNLLRS